MAGYSGTPLWKKLGYQPGIVAVVESAPEQYQAALGLPREIAPVWRTRVGADTRLVHVFVTRLATLQKRLVALRKIIPPDGMVWISWPKKESGVATDVTDDRIRDAALPLGFVDVKVCAVDETWSGLKLVVRKSER